MNTVCVVGLGYIGLPTAAMLASRGHAVIGCDIAPHVVRAVGAGQAHFREPDLDMLLAAAVQTGRLRAQAMPAPADAFIIATPTPLGPGNRPDLSSVMAAADSIAPVLRPGAVVILESTVPVGTTEALARRIAAARPDLALPRLGGRGEVHLAHCPEQILPGSMLRELVENDRIIGGLGPDCARQAARLYGGFVTGRMHLTDCRTAEFVKLAENAFRDVNIAFANEMALVCEGLGLDVWHALDLANRHPRVQVLRPGAGVGGHCIAVDPWFLVDGAPDATPLLRAARAVNEARPGQVVARLRAQAARFRDPVVACLGLTYKPDVDDMRESPSVRIIRELADGTMEILVCDPWVAALPPDLAALPRVRLVDAGTALARADILALLVGHTAFRELDRRLLDTKVVLDAVGLLRV